MVELKIDYKDNLLDRYVKNLKASVQEHNLYIHIQTLDKPCVTHEILSDLIHELYDRKDWEVLYLTNIDKLKYDKTIQLSSNNGYIFTAKHDNSKSYITKYGPLKHGEHVIALCLDSPCFKSGQCENILGFHLYVGAIVLSITIIIILHIYFKKK